MFYLPVGCLKIIVIVGSTLSIAMSGGLLTLAIVASLDKKDVVDNVNETFINSLLVGLFVCSIVLLLLSLSGLYGACKTRKKHNKVGNCLLGGYFVGVMIFFVVFLVGTVFAFIGPSSIFGDSCEKGSKTSLIGDIYDVNKNATRDFCHESCPCQIYRENEDSFLANWLQAQNYTYAIDDKALSYRDCMEKEEDEEAVVLLMTGLEAAFGCTGWCESDEDKFFKFSDINNCVTEDCLDRDSCYKSFSEFVHNKSDIFGAALLIGTLICLVNIITVCCLCYHPMQRKKIKNFYHRMLES